MSRAESDGLGVCDAAVARGVWETAHAVFYEAALRSREDLGTTGACFGVRCQSRWYGAARGVAIASVGLVEILPVVD